MARVIYRFIIVLIKYFHISANNAKKKKILVVPAATAATATLGMVPSNDRTPCTIIIVHFILIKIECLAIVRSLIEFD